MRIISDNYLDSLALVPSNVDLNYPIENVQDQRLSTKFHSTTTSVYITVTCPSIITEPVAVGILGHNISDGATVEFQLSETSNFASTISEILIWDEDIILKFIDYSSTSFEYIRFYVSDLSNTDGYISIGRLWVGSYFPIIPSSLLDFKVTYNTSDTNIYGKDRQKFALQGVIWRKFQLDFPESDNGMICLLNDFIDRVGNHKSFIFCNFDELTSYVLVKPCYVSLSEEIGFSHKKRMKFSYSLSMEEDL